MTAILYVLIGLFGGAVLIGIIVAVVVSLRYVREIKSSLDQLTSVLHAISKDNTLVENLGAFKELVNTGKSVMQKMDVLTRTFEMFNKLAFEANQLAKVTATMPAGEGSSATYPYDERTAAEREAHRAATRAGVAEVSIEQPIPSDKAVKAGDV